VTRKSPARYALGLCAACGLLAALPAPAQQLPDPTRPPSMLNQDGGAAAAAGPVLQSVLISPERRMAIISGKQVELGGEFDGARVTSISETQVVLRSGGASRTLKLYPDIDKRGAAADAGTRTIHRKR